MEFEVKTHKKTDLLKFQKALNKQFLEIFSKNGLVGSEDLEGTDTLGLSTYFRDFNIFISLRDLHSIATKLNYENSVLTKSWILGFNKDHGNIYTILNLDKVFNLIFENKTDFDEPNININTNIVYLRKRNDEHYGLLLNEFSLGYTAEFTPIFNLTNNEDDSYIWKFNDSIEFNSFVKKENMSINEYELINKIYKDSQNKEIHKFNVFPKYNEKDKYGLMSLFFNNIYLDANGKRPVFSLDSQNLTKFLIGLSPL